MDDDKKRKSEDLLRQLDDKIENLKKKIPEIIEYVEKTTGKKLTQREKDLLLKILEGEMEELITAKNELESLINDEYGNQ